jgi:hypothetical protein
MATTPSLKDDLLTGAEAIATFVGWPRWKIYKYQKELELDRVGQTLIGRKSRLDRRLGGSPAAISKHVTA